MFILLTTELEGKSTRLYRYPRSPWREWLAPRPPGLNYDLKR